jgi:hypothetical protein
MLGHARPDKTTQICAPYDPDYCRDAAQAIDLVMRDLQKLVSYPIIGPKVGKVVGTVGIEPTTPAVSRRCSAAELSARKPNA